MSEVTSPVLQPHILGLVEQISERGIPPYIGVMAGRSLPIAAELAECMLPKPQVIGPDEVDLHAFASRLRRRFNGRVAQGVILTGPDASESDIDEAIEFAARLGKFGLISRFESVPSPQ